MKYTRRTARGSEMGTVLLRNSYGHTVTLVAVQHVATQDSWDHDIAMLRRWEAEGRTIHLEGVRPVSEKVTAEEQARLNTITTLGDVSKLLAETTGLVYQKDAFAAADARWIPVDMSALDIARALKPRTVRRLEKLGRMDLDILKSSPDTVLAMLRLLPVMPGFLSLFIGGDLSKNILHRRNEYAVSSVMFSSAPAHVLYWGAAHLPGMVKLFEAEGFTMVEGSLQWRVVLPAAYTP
jgi:hypothetical protein